MSTLFPSYNAGPFFTAAVDMLLDQTTTHGTPFAMTRRSSRGAGCRNSRPMRVSKTPSANNSPRESMLSRRRTMMNDVPQHYMAMLASQATLDAGAVTMSSRGQQRPARSSRPVSWHPSSQIPNQVSYGSGYPPSTQAIDPFTNMEMQMQQHLGFHTTPPSAISSPALQYADFAQNQSHDQFQYPLVAAFPQQQLFEYEYDFTQIPQHPILASDNGFSDVTNAPVAGYAWNSFAAGGFEDADTAPPTPDSFLPIQHPESTFATEHIPYHSLSDEEPEGEVLIGMGLYDTPDKEPSDIHLDGYRALMKSQLLETPTRREPTQGKGLKLEETWQPPPSDDEDEDAESEEDSEVQAETSDAVEVSEELEHVPSEDFTADILNNYSEPQFVPGGWI